MNSFLASLVTVLPSLHAVAPVSIICSTATVFSHKGCLCFQLFLILAAVCFDGQTAFPSSPLLCSTDSPTALDSPISLNPDPEHQRQRRFDSSQGVKQLSTNMRASGPDPSDNPISLRCWQIIQLAHWPVKHDWPAGCFGSVILLTWRSASHFKQLLSVAFNKDSSGNSQ